VPYRVYYERGDALSAERIAEEVRDIDRIRVIEGSGRHRIQSTTLRDSTFCVVGEPLEAVKEKSSRI
jgi:hypothetical protein